MHGAYAGLGVWGQPTTKTITMKTATMNEELKTETTRPDPAEVLREIIHGIIFVHKEANIQMQTLGRNTIVGISVTRSDFKLLLGSGGSTIRAIKSLFAVVSEKTGQSIEIELDEPPKGGDKLNPPLKIRDVWKKKETAELLEKLCRMVFDHFVRLRITDGIRGYSVCEIELTTEEDFEKTSRLHADIETVFRQIGYNLGRKLKIDVVRV